MNEPPQAQGQRRDALFFALFLVLCTLFCGVWLRMPCGTFYSPDGGGRYLQMQSMGNHPFMPANLIYPGILKDPTLSYYPARVEYALWSTHAYPFINAEGRVQTNWLPWFPWISRPIFMWLGPRGLILIPLLGGLLAVWLTGKLAGTMARGTRPLALAAFALASPLLFYCLTFWEHTVALAFQLAALFCVLPRGADEPAGRSAAAIRMTAAMALLLGALALRREASFFLASLCLVLILQNGKIWFQEVMRRKTLFIVCVLATMAALFSLHPWLLPERTITDLTSTFHRLASWNLWRGLGPHFFDVFFLRNWESQLPTTLRWAGQTGLALCLVNALWPRARHPGGFVAGFLLILPAALFMAYTPIRYRALSSLVLSAPFVLFALLPRSSREPLSASERFVQTLAALYALLFFLGTWPSCRGHGAPEWGSRYALVLFALLSALGAANVIRWRKSLEVRGWRRPAMMALVFLSIVAGSSSLVRGVRELRATRKDLARIADVLGTNPTPIVTDCWWMGVGMPDLFMRQEIYALASPDELHGWIDAIGKNESLFRYASYERLPTANRLREERRLAFVSREEVCGMGIDTYRVLSGPR